MPAQLHVYLQCVIPIPIDYRKKQSAQGAKEKLPMQAGTAKARKDLGRV